MQTILIIGGAGAQGAALVRHLSNTSLYTITIQTRTPSSPTAQALASLPNVSLIQGAYSDAALTTALKDQDLVFVNTDGFAVGQAAETYWGIRIFELAQRAGVKHLVYSGLDYVGPKTGFDPKFEVGHYLGKAYVAEYMKAQPTSPMRWSVVNSGPYMETLFDNLKPRVSADGKEVTLTFPLGEGAVPFIVLSDFARYVDWLFQHPEESTGMILDVATTLASGQDVADAFNATNPDKKGIYLDVPIDAWHDAAWASLPKKKHTKIGFRSVDDERALLQTYEQNFTAWWALYKASAGNQPDGVIVRDYALLDRILPDRIRSVDEWMKEAGYNGEGKKVLQHSTKA